MTRNAAEAISETSEDIQALAQRIWRSQMESGSAEMQRLPGERELSQTYGVARRAVSRAIALLETEGLVCRMARSGTFVRNPKTTPGHAVEPTCKCINFLHPLGLESGPLQWLLQDYLAGYTEALERFHVKTRFVPCADEHSDFENLFWPQAPFREQACILMNRRSPELLNWLKKARIPFVMQAPYHYECAGLPEHHKVYINKAGGAFLGTRHLMELGHRRIGYIGEMPGHGGAYPIYEGFCAAMRCAGLSVEAGDALWTVLDVIPTDLTPIVEYLKRANRPGAILCSNDYTAMSVLEASRQLGIAVPRELSLVGVNDQIEAATTDPPLTTVAIPRRQLAAASVEMLLSVMRAKPKTFETRILECELVTRGTTAPLTS